MKWPVYAVALLVSAAGSGAAWAVPRQFEAISLDRGMYMFTVTADGSVTYEGRRWVKVIGTRTKHISRVRVNRIRKAIADLEFFALRDQYESRRDGCQLVSTDSGGVDIVVKAGGETKKVSHYHGCLERGDQKDAYNLVGPIFPRRLTAFEEEIERIVGTRDWIGPKEWKYHEWLKEEMKRQR